jgi:hypothetical protein
LTIQFSFENAITLIFNLSDTLSSWQLNNNYGVNVFKHGLNMIELAVFLMQLHDHHAKMVMAFKPCFLKETTSTRRDSSCTSSHQILFTKF